MNTKHELPEMDTELEGRPRSKKAKTKSTSKHSGSSRVDSQFVNGMEDSLVKSESPFLVSYIFSRQEVIDSHNLPAIGSLVSVRIESPHLNITQGASDSLVGCNILDLNADNFHYFPNTSSADIIYSNSLSEYRSDMDEDFRDPYSIEMYGQVIDYTFAKPDLDVNVDSEDDELSTSVIVHLVLNPFSSESETYAKIACTIKDTDSDLTSLESTNIVDAFKPKYTF